MRATSAHCDSSAPASSRSTAASTWARNAATCSQSGRDIVRVEERGEAFVEDAIAGELRQQEKLLEEPARMRAVPLDRARIGHRLHDLILGAQARGTALRFRAHRAERIVPSGPAIGRRGSWDRCGITLVTAATKDR